MRNPREYKLFIETSSGKLYRVVPNIEQIEGFEELLGNLYFDTEGFLHPQHWGLKRLRYGTISGVVYE